MKVLSLLKSFASIVLVALLATSCGKISVNPESGQDGLPDTSYSIAGDWVLKYSDGGITNTHVVYPLDGSTPFPSGNVISWASHLRLFENDSAYWNSSGIDANPVFFSNGTYSVSQSGDSNPVLILSFAINNYSTFEYTFKTNDTLVLKDQSDHPTFSAYARN